VHDLPLPIHSTGDFQGWGEGRKTGSSFSGLSTNRHFHGPFALRLVCHADLFICSNIVFLASCIRRAASVSPHGCGHALECRNAQSGAQKLLRTVKREQRFQRCAPQPVNAAFAALVVDQDFGLGRGPVVVDVGIEEAGIERVERRGLSWAEVSPADVFAHDGGIFGLHQTVVARAARAAFGLGLSGSQMSSFSSN